MGSLRDYLLDYYFCSWIQCHSCSSSISYKANEKEGMGGFGAGEYDTIQLFYNGMGNFIITDDGSAARYCTGEGIPFINALLFPVVLGVAGIKNDGYCQQAMEKIIEHGHYSPEIVDYARNCDADTIQFALP